MMATTANSSEVPPLPLLVAPHQLRILCLHDAHSNAQELKESLALLGDRLYEKHGIDLVFVNSPLALPTTTSPHNTSSNTTSAEEPSARVWWHDDDEEEATDNRFHQNAHVEARESATTISRSGGEEIDNNEHVNNDAEASEISPYTGLDASLLLLQQVWNSSPFWGILGVGQGAAIASVLALCLLPRTSTTTPPPCFCIFVSGTALLSETERLVGVEMPCLHLIDPTDYDCEGQERLIQQFGGEIHERSTSPAFSSSRRHPLLFFSKSDLNLIGRFLIAQKNALHGNNSNSSNGNAEIVALQSALHLAELQAADTIAEQIAASPPDALMAVIRPQAGVAGLWSGTKRRQPNEEGGGAPCPSEFLLKREKRPNAQESGASRAHPGKKEAEYVNNEL